MMGPEPMIKICSMSLRLGMRKYQYILEYAKGTITLKSTLGKGINFIRNFSKILLYFSLKWIENRALQDGWKISTSCHFYNRVLYLIRTANDFDGLAKGVKVTEGFNDTDC